MLDRYQFSGSLPENASTYVTRKADSDLYAGLKAGKFCYVLNSRQSGKSSLRVRTMQRLREEGVQCAAIDLSAGGIQNVPPEQWYADLIDNLIETFDLDVDFGDWWEANQLNSLVTRFRKFLEEILLAEVKENIVIFIDEIDSVLSLKFPTDDFFALIRACYNKRVDNAEYNRLTFCLLGVASPSNLIEDKQRTPFNIGQAISLIGFQLYEIEPLAKGMSGRFSNPQLVMQEILYWTGGQPFLTQKLCQFMIEESFVDNPRTVEQVVKSRIIENWESQDEPEHLRTIQARILCDEQRAGYLLELYQKIRLRDEQSEITADDTLEQSELQLSGLIVRQQNNLRVYNPIYQEVFNQVWIDNQLKNLRPYSENFRFWVASEGKDISRLLRGKALEEAEAWAKPKSLSYQDRQFLAASKEQEIQEEIAAKEQEAALERERKDKEAAEKRNLMLAEANQKLAEANQKAQQRVRIGSVVLLLTLLGATISIIWAGKDIQDIRENTKYVSQLSKLSEELYKKDKSSASQAREQIGLSYEIKNHELKKAMLFTSMSQAYQQLEQWEQAEKEIRESLDILEANKHNIDSSEGLQIKVLANKVQGDLFLHKKERNQAIESYKSAFKILKYHPEQTSPFTKTNQLLTAKDIEAVHRNLLDLLSTNTPAAKLRKQVEKYLTQHLYAQLEYYLKAKNWQAADKQTYLLMLNVAKREKEKYLDINSINNFSCLDLKTIDQLWVTNSDKRFGFSVQKEIWTSTGNRLGKKPEVIDTIETIDVIGTKIDFENYIRFATSVGWYDGKNRYNKLLVTPVRYDELLRRIKDNLISYKGSLPIMGGEVQTGSLVFSEQEIYSYLFYKWSLLFLSRVATCKV
ncbi:MAG: AAA-like domain-containing protein [Aulosira sp. ZfuVER01]|nr:AAA-like domain-containing protein [Aulosira sp. ZfuVER01]MDZ7999269.1 AAA-like domain-containing protein [Aulosira sp. DedVER01a]MDZ8051950.1 AAA-like domain-containing protein [Aulosira sp. ZfuCHP01]